MQQKQRSETGPMKAPIDRHLEAVLGPMIQGWSPTGEPAGVHVVLFGHQPLDGTVTYATLGLSQHVLDMPKGRSVRQELLLAVQAGSAMDDFSKLLLHVAESVVGTHRALLRGDVFPLGHPIVRGSSCCHLYVSLPVVFPEGLATCDSTEPPTVFAWLVPVTDREEREIRTVGWSRFEDKLERADVDLFDLARSSVA